MKATTIHRGESNGLYAGVRRRASDRPAGRRDGATPPGAGAALIRTLLGIDGLFGYLAGFIIVLASDRRRRLGDMAARTQVVRG